MLPPNQPTPSSLFVVLFTAESATLSPLLLLNCTAPPFLRLCSVSRPTSMSYLLPIHSLMKVSNSRPLSSLVTFQLPRGGSRRKSEGESEIEKVKLSLALSLFANGIRRCGSDIFSRVEDTNIMKKCVRPFGRWTENVDFLCFCSSSCFCWWCWWSMSVTDWAVSQKWV